MTGPVVDVHSNDGLSSRHDKALFLVLFLVGASLIIWQKVVANRLWIPVMTGAGLIILYCAIASRVERFRLRDDRVGEGAYYLGFLYTLVSLAVALYQFSEGGSDAALISRFGISLGTTICGIVCRVVFQQLRETPDDADEDVRESLAQAVFRVRGELDQSVELFAVFRKRIEEETAAAIGSGMNQIIVDYKERMADVVLDLRTQATAALDGVTAAVTGAQAISAKHREASARLVTALDGVSERIEKSPSPLEPLIPLIDETAQFVKKLGSVETKRIEAHRKAMESLSEAHREVVEQARNGAATIAVAEEAAAGMAKALEQGSKAISQIDGQLAAMSGTSAKAQEDLKLMVETLKAQVAQSQAGLLALQAQVVNAAETIVREIGGR